MEDTKDDTFSIGRMQSRSQMLILDEFEIIDLNLHLIKSTHENALSSDAKISHLQNTIEGGENDTIEKVSEAKLFEMMKKQDASVESLCRLDGRSSELLVIRKRSSEQKLKAASHEETVLNIVEPNKINIEENEDKRAEPDQPIESKEQATSGIAVSIDRRDICRNKTCYDSKFHLPPIRRTDSQNLAWDVKALGVQQSTENRGLSSTKRVDMRRKGRHDYIVKEIDLRMNDLNDVIEQELRKEAENLVSNIEMIKESVEQIMTTLKEKQLASLNTKVILRMQEIMKQLNDNRLSKIDSFCEFVRNLERHRSDRFKIILKNAYKQMHVNMYLTPFEIQMYFEKKIQHLNEITLNNYHCYTELQKKLKIQMEEEMRLWFQVLKCQESIARSAVKKDECYKEVLHEISGGTPADATKEDMLKKLKKAEEDFVRLKRITDNLTYLKFHPTIEVFENYLEEMANIVTTLTKAGLVSKEGLLLNQKAMQDLSSMHCIDEEELQNMWENAIQEFIEKLDNNLKSFSNSSHIFDCYVNRLEEMKSLYWQQLFLLKTKNDKESARMNNDMNILIDTLRQSGSEDVLKQTYQQIQANILNIDNLIQDHLKEETALVDKFLTLSQCNVDILLDELNRFVKQFVPPPDSDPRKMKKRASWMNVDELKTNDHLFSRDFLECRFLMQNVDNWQFGVWHALVTTMETSKQVIGMISENWANSERQKLANRSEVKRSINNVRIYNIKGDFYKVRLVELKIHEERFLQHESAVRGKVSKLSNQKSVMIETFEKFLETEYTNKINEIMDEYANVRKERQAVSILNKLKAMDSSASLDMKNRHEQFKKLYYTSLDAIRNSHIEFMKSIKLFSENGNFTADEAKAAVKKITALEKLMSKEFTNCTENIDRIYINFIDACQRKLETPLFNLNKTIKELKFKDEIDCRIKKLIREMGELIFNFTYDVKKLNDKIKSWYDASYERENLGSYQYLFSFSRCFKEYLADINTAREKLEYDGNLAARENLLKQPQVSEISMASMNKQKKNKDSKVISDPKKLETKHSMRISALPKNKSNMYVLYQYTPPDNGTLLSSLHTKILKSYNETQEFARVFYENHGNVTENNHIPPDHKKFMEAILGKYKYFQLQVEFAWLDNAIEFVEFLTYFRRFVENYYEDSLNKFFENRKDELTSKCLVVTEFLKNNLKAVEDNYTSTHNKLKTMFGHPEKAQILATVETYIDEAEEFNHRILLDKLEPSKDAIKQHCIATESIFLDMEKILQCIKGSNTLLTISKDLDDTVFERIEILHNIISSDDLGPNAANQTDFDMDFRTRLQDYKFRAKIPQDCVVSYSSIFQNLPPITISTHVNKEIMVENNFKEFNNISDQIDSLGTKCLTIHDKYQTMWKQDIERILNLYKLKYDTPVSG